MGKVMSLINTTPDGFVDGKYAITDEEFYEFVHGLLAETETVAFGSNTFTIFQDRWTATLENESAEAHQLKMARALNNTHKTVYSSSLKTTYWNNSSIEPEVDAKQINAYKQKGQKGLLTIGSLGLVAALTEMNLIDDYYFCVQPLIAGNGDVRLFDKMNLHTTRSLKYVDSKQLKNGVHIIHYQRA
jgi:dihydrofolate reductase